MAAQEPPVFRARTDAVFVPVTVTDRAGRFVHGLTADQFEISEDGTRRAVAQFSAGRVPVSLGILLDIGGSMTPGPNAVGSDDARWADTRRALELLVTRLEAADEVFLAVFNDRVAATPWTQDHAGILREFDVLRPGGGNAVLDAVQLIAPIFELAQHQRKVLLLISDGNDTMLPTASSTGPVSNRGSDPGQWRITAALAAATHRCDQERHPSSRARSCTRSAHPQRRAGGYGTAGRSDDRVGRLR